jgi:hypothetical protein
LVLASISGLPTPKRSVTPMAKEMRIARIEKLAEQHEAAKAEDGYGDPNVGPNVRSIEEQRGEELGLGRFDPSVGKQAQKTPERPLGGDAAISGLTKDAEQAMVIRKRFALRETALML